MSSATSPGETAGEPATYRMTIIFRVPDHEAWHGVLLRQHADDHPGLLRRDVYTSIDDPNEVMIELEFDSARAATTYLPSLPARELREQMSEEASEVSGETGPDTYPPVFIGTVDPSLALRSRPGPPTGA